MAGVRRQIVCSIEVGGMGRRQREAMIQALSVGESVAPQQASRRGRLTRILCLYPACMVRDLNGVSLRKYFLRVNIIVKVGFYFRKLWICFRDTLIFIYI